MSEKQDGWIVKKMIMSGNYYWDDEKCEEKSLYTHTLNDVDNFPNIALKD